MRPPPRPMPTGPLRVHPRDGRDKRSGPGIGGRGAAGSTPSTGPPAEGRDPRVVRTFIVEDSEIILDNLTATLEEMAPVRIVGHAPDEEAAVRRLLDLGDEIDLVIIDVFLKSGSGLGVLRSLAHAGLPARRVVLTNYATAEMRERCEAIGAHRVLDKSRDLDELIAYCARLAKTPEDRSPGHLN